jgi:Synergist-CTERM protein sorting domain-containing protein
MKRKNLPRLGFLAFALFLIFSGFACAQELQKAPLNPEFVEYQKRLQTAEGREEALYGYRPSPVDLSHIRGPIFGGLRTAAYPSTYDLRDVSGVSYVSPVRNQNPFGTCWAFGAMGSLESTALRNKQGLFAAAVPDYSEWHLAYFAYTDQNTELVSFTRDTLSPGENEIFDQGASVTQATAILARWTGAVDETDCPYWDTDKNPPASVLPTGSEPNARWLTSVVLLGESDSTPYVQDDVKYALTYYGACAIRFCVLGDMDVTDAYWNAAENCYYAASSASTGGHIVTIVGWDDAYPAANFSTVPLDGDGAWIVKNSWGTGWGDSGYFYLSYHDANIGYPAVFLGNTTTFEYVYQYDPLGWTNSYGYGSPTAYFANVFTAGTGSSASGPLKSAATEALKAVSFYMATPGSSYNIWVYTGVTGSPATGTLAYGPEASVFTAPGYYTIILDEEIPLVPGEKFAVVVELTTPGYNWPIPIENLIVGYSEKARAHAGESYISANGTTWTDITTVGGQEDTNVALKAFTGPYTGPTVTPTPTGTPTVTPTTTPIPTPGSGGGGGGCSALGFAPLGLLFLLPLLVLKK